MYTQVILLMMHVVVFSGDGVNLSKPELASAAQVHYLSLIQRWDSITKILFLNFRLKENFLSDPHSYWPYLNSGPKKQVHCNGPSWVWHAKCAWSSFLFRWKRDKRYKLQEVCPAEKDYFFLVKIWSIWKIGESTYVREVLSADKGYKELCSQQLVSHCTL